MKDSEKCLNSKQGPLSVYVVHPTGHKVEVEPVLRSAPLKFQQEDHFQQMFPVMKKGPTKNRMAAKINQVICNSRSFKVTNIRPARKSAELVRRQHA